MGGIFINVKLKLIKVDETNFRKEEIIEKIVPNCNVTLAIFKNIVKKKLEELDKLQFFDYEVERCSYEIDEKQILRIEGRCNFYAVSGFKEDTEIEEEHLRKIAQDCDNQLAQLSVELSENNIEELKTKYDVRKDICPRSDDILLLGASESLTFRN